MNVIPTNLQGVVLFEPQVFGDERGFFLETYHAERYAKHEVPDRFVQDNLSHSTRGVLRGLHFQNPHRQGKLVQVLGGEVYDVAVDVRRDSPNFGKWVGEILSAENKRQLYIPEGFAHGFCVMSSTALFFYKCTDYYRPDCEITISWDDPDIGITWPVESPIVSEKDGRGKPLREIASRLLSI